MGFFDAKHWCIKCGKDFRSPAYPGPVFCVSCEDNIRKTDLCVKDQLGWCQCSVCDHGFLTTGEKNV